MHSRIVQSVCPAVYLAAALGGLPLCVSHAAAGWVEFVDETATRLDAPPELVGQDDREKDYAWGDVDLDGDIDLVIVRKQPWVTPGKNANVLLLNQNGVLVDRTADFAVQSDVAGDQGFLTPTNDRDVVLVDVDLDGWLDIVTATTLSPDDEKAVGHPRVYINLRCEEPCEGTEHWLGFRYEEARIPAMLSHSGQAGFNPNFCAVTAGDVTGDGYPDLWFADYDVTADSPPDDFNDKLLVNEGAANPGFFHDATAERFSGVVPGIGPFEVSGFGASGAIADLNGDSMNEVVRQDTEWVGAAINGGTAEGFFDTYAVAYSNTSYFVSVGDLNQDDKLDLVLTDAGADRYLLNTVNIDGTLDFLDAVFSFSHGGSGGPSSDDGFGDNNLIVDLDRDGWNDVVVADVDIRLEGCTRRMHVYRNLGGNPGSGVILQEQTSGTGCETFLGNPESCIVAGIPSDKLEGTHDVAVFDINGDAWPDLVVGRCDGTEIYINQPPVDPVGSIPDGEGVPGIPLTLGKSDGQIALAWGESCSSGDNDYAVYRGALGGGFNDHTELTCTTGGATSYSFEPGAGDAYYLVVPGNGIFEGSYGFDSDGVPRQPGSSACAPMNSAPCG